MSPRSSDQQQKNCLYANRRSDPDGRLTALNCEQRRVHLLNGSTNYGILEYIYCLERLFDVVLTTPKKHSTVRSTQCLARSIGRCASEEVILDLVRSKCLPSLLYGTEACPLNKTELRSLNFTITRILMKLFNTYSAQIIVELQEYLNFSSCECLIKKRTLIFLRK